MIPKGGLIPVRHGIKLSITKRPDISFSVNVTNRYRVDPDKVYWEEVKAILKYLRRTKDPCFVYGERNLEMVGITDSDFNLTMMIGDQHRGMFSP